MKNLTLSLLLTTAPLFAGVEAPIMAPPAPDCQAGFTLGLEALYLRAYQSDGGYNKGDFDFGGRGSLGYDFDNCLFIKATYFGYGSSVYHDSGSDDGYSYREDADLDVSYLDLVVGEHFKPSDKLTLSPFVGLRWATFDENSKGREVRQNNNIQIDLGEQVSTYRADSEFSGLGAVVGIDGTRMLGGGFSLYGTLKQSVVFGTRDLSYRYNQEGAQPKRLVESDSYSEDTVIFISELGLGVQYDFNIASVAANIHAGVEGQWWSSPSAGGGEKRGGEADVGLGGFVLGANFKF